MSNQLDQNVPNPFDPPTVIEYGIAGDNPVSLTIYVAGKFSQTKKMVLLK